MNVHTLGGGSPAAGAVDAPVPPVQATLMRPAATALAAPPPELARAGSTGGLVVPRPDPALAFYGAPVLGLGRGFTSAAPTMALLTRRSTENPVATATFRADGRPGRDEQAMKRRCGRAGSGEHTVARRLSRRTGTGCMSIRFGAAGPCGR